MPLLTADRKKDVLDAIVLLQLSRVVCISRLRIANLGSSIGLNVHVYGGDRSFFASADELNNSFEDLVERAISYMQSDRWDFEGTLINERSITIHIDTLFMSYFLVCALGAVGRWRRIAQQVAEHVRWNDPDCSGRWCSFGYLLESDNCGPMIHPSI